MPRQLKSKLSNLAANFWCLPLLTAWPKKICAGQLWIYELTASERGHSDSVKVWVPISGSQADVFSANEGCSHHEQTARLSAGAYASLICCQSFAGTSQKQETRPNQQFINSMATVFRLSCARSKNYFKESISVIDTLCSGRPIIFLFELSEECKDTDRERESFCLELILNGSIVEVAIE